LDELDEMVDIMSNRELAGFENRMRVHDAQPQSGRPQQALTNTSRNRPSWILNYSAVGNIGDTWRHEE
jgi:hypothetical protein